MKLLNIGCGATRPGNPWTNVDTLKKFFSTDERFGGELEEINKEPNYVEHDITVLPWPFPENEFDAVLASHVIEHFDCRVGSAIMSEARRVLKPDGLLVVSVPDVTYFRSVYRDDRNENWHHLFGITDPKNPIPTWFEAALWFNEHHAILADDSVWAYFIRAGFKVESIRQWEPDATTGENPLRDIIKGVLNRSKFSLVMIGRK